MRQKILLVLFLIISILLSFYHPAVGYGAAPDYIPVEGNGIPRFEPNCYAFVLGYSSYGQSFSPGEFSDPYAESFLEHSLEAITFAVLADLRALGRSARIIYSYNAPIRSSEYRIALRVKIVRSPTKPDLDWDYHFMVQTSTGCWAEKAGRNTASVLYGPDITPKTAPWSLDGEEKYYDSSIIYFAISQ